ncbi:MAG: hypothetical protein SPI59_01395 [Finegoldia sp.]|nr:hypothetical protein [Finegoldia sp.]
MGQYLALLIIKYQNVKNFYVSAFRVKQYQIMQYATDLWLIYYGRSDLIDHVNAPYQGKVLPNGLVDIYSPVE